MDWIFDFAILSGGGRRLSTIRVVIVGALSTGSGKDTDLWLLRSRDTRGGLAAASAIVSRFEPRTRLARSSSDSELIDIGSVEICKDCKIGSGVGVSGVIADGSDIDLELSVGGFAVLVEAVSKKLVSNGSLGCGVLFWDRGGGDGFGSETSWPVFAICFLCIPSIRLEAEVGVGGNGFGDGRPDIDRGDGGMGNDLGEGGIGNDLGDMISSVERSLFEDRGM